MDTIQLAHGSGGLENQQLIRELFFAAFDNPMLAACEDAALIEGGRFAVSTDSFTVSPLFFPGGDIGKLAVAGTLNDVAMRGARPQHLTVAFIIEEGLKVNTLASIVLSMKDELSISGAQVIAGDTKVVPRGAIDQLMINTTGFGAIVSDCNTRRIAAGDHLIISGNIARHGACIFAAREEIAIKGLTSDCCTLWPAIAPLLHAGLGIHAMRDATRGGISAVLNEWAQQTGLCLNIRQDDIPVSSEVRGFAEILGIDPYVLACEGVFILAVAPQDSTAVIDLLRHHGHPQATLVGTVGMAQQQPAVLLHSAYGTRRRMEYPSGEILPRIC
ncbi:MAG: hydrogenase expression/formation protein HypE [Desulfuromonadales bacterium]|nr:hydrogenase expression/formation protein HypE [Desulfuromonadales bacterium]